MYRFVESEKRPLPVTRTSEDFDGKSPRQNGELTQIAFTDLILADKRPFE